MNIEHLRDFLCVCETMNMTAAAARRHTTQSNLSKRLRSLETSIGQDLIDRTSRPMTLTSAGESFAKRARRALDQLEGLRIDALPWWVSEGALRIAMPHGASVDVFPHFKLRVQEKLNGTYLIPLIANEDTAAQMISRSQCDLALVHHHETVAHADGLAVFKGAKIASDRLVLVRPGQGQARSDERCFIPHRGTYLGRVWQAAGSATRKPEIELGMAVDIRASCLSGAGAGVLPFSLIEADVALGRLLIEDDVLPIDYDLVLYCAPEASPKARELWQAIEQDPNRALAPSSRRTGDISPV
ncbi:LysR family transcriptional regulator [Aurantimonas sp. VKM B-3413]|uniref:LysR family transcriptional regulator n=1 Tax=Aurantimonas sp. VKM B-3413 TaxID=2779401 RepID=UPI001E417269|nr:LysR family transcriptional regulator [Aurantimonas sp. VKM B-3413]MCB8840154.1 LysR family transcriptional regulator [Aurantimonas sp. VKM B-3413]